MMTVLLLLFWPTAVIRSSVVLCSLRCIGLKEKRKKKCFVVFCLEAARMTLASSPATHFAPPPTTTGTKRAILFTTPPPRDITETIDVKNQNVIGRLLCVYILYRYSPALKAYAFPRPPKKRGSGEKQTQQNVARMEGKSVIAQKLWTYFIGFICNWIIGLGNAAESSTMGEGGIYRQGGITRGNRIEENSK